MAFEYGMYTCNFINMLAQCKITLLPIYLQFEIGMFVLKYIIFNQRIHIIANFCGFASLIKYYMYNVYNTKPNVKCTLQSH